MNTTSSALTDVTAMTMWLALLSMGTVALIGGTGLMMWVFGF
jgi:hypothetical protein